MRVARIVRQLLSKGSQSVHAARMAAVLVTVEAIVRAGRLSLSAIGRSTPRRTSPKHSIKSVDRLLSNSRLLSEGGTLYAAICRWIVGDQRDPVVLVDWTRLTDGFHALVAAVPVAGRALPIFIEVHPERRQGVPSVEARFLRRLEKILPEGTRPVIVADAGFRGPFFRAILERGWDFVGRLRGTHNVVRPDGEVLDRATLTALARPTPRDLGPVRLYTWATPVPARVVVVRARRKPGPRRASTSAKDAAARDAAREPWLLATSLDQPAVNIVTLYARRMKIEETFRDAKNHRFGWSFRHVRCKSAARLSNLMLLTTLAFAALTIIGLVAERAGIHRAYQANTVRRRVLSLAVLGAALYRRGDPFLTQIPHRLDALRPHLRDA